MERGATARRSAGYLALAEQLSPHLSGPTAHRLADVTEDVGGEALLAGDFTHDEHAWVVEALRRVESTRVDFWAQEIDRLAAAGVEMMTIEDPTYPVNLRMVHNRPPVLFVRGRLDDVDQRAMAVVGTRQASEAGLRNAYALAEQLARRQVTVVSGLAEGIDTAAHAGALTGGGRTIAVFGTGIQRVYPRTNATLARSIERSGACISQFWPGQSGARWTFPLRNIVTSGLSLGTVVVEAGESSGAKLQAHDALAHGKRLFLVRDLVMTQPWAEAMATMPMVRVVDDVDEVVHAVDVDLDTSADLDLAL